MTDLFLQNIGPQGEIKGSRIQLAFTDDQYTTLKSGDQGSVDFIDDYGTIHVKWDNGCTLGLIPDHDKWKLLSA